MSAKINNLQQCGLSRLDGDRDGVPCESLCR
ncbi:excalibur calcium-binding domain-containing protein [Teichococcus oryzae]|uniref:Excalibur calcium-binding domain-containing protein n=1 Tax=Teichococcus oryzae TaxID=1608942 RepID=A0A5B2T9M4_9PROT|nr:excalibur calcium-binding domain-containing protein [Pseudoroseomonas oryzae]